jgi:hypothetical protein
MDYISNYGTPVTQMTYDPALLQHQISPEYMTSSQTPSTGFKATKLEGEAINAWKTRSLHLNAPQD